MQYITFLWLHHICQYSQCRHDNTLVTVTEGFPCGKMEYICSGCLCTSIRVQRKAGWEKGGHDAIVVRSKKTRYLPHSQYGREVLCGERLLEESRCWFKENKEVANRRWEMTLSIVHMQVCSKSTGTIFIFYTRDRMNLYLILSVRITSPNSIVMSLDKLPGKYFKTGNRLLCIFAPCM